MKYNITLYIIANCKYVFFFQNQLISKERSAKVQTELNLIAGNIFIRVLGPNMFKPCINFLTDHSKAVLLLWIFLLFVFHVILSWLFQAALCSSAATGLTSWLSCM